MEFIRRRKRKSVLMKRKSTCKVPEVARSWKKAEVTGTQSEEEMGRAEVRERGRGLAWSREQLEGQGWTNTTSCP